MAAPAFNLDPALEAQLAEFIGKFHDDPLGFVMACFPWGEAELADGSSNPLKNKKGPEKWQTKFLKKLGEHIKNNNKLAAYELMLNVWRSAVASGHGVGKSALVAWLIIFFMATRRDTRGAVTANTQGQLESRTWPELAKWHNLFISKHWFTWTATSYYFSLYPEERRKNYMVTAATVSEENTEAFQGLHNEGNTIFVIFDEASGIDEKIWEVSTGALTDGEGFFFAFGNPTRPDGAFADAFDKNAAKYYLDHVDSREVSFTNKNALQDIIDLYGVDDDRTRIRVYGQFPRQSFNGFISPEAVREAQTRELIEDHGAALIMAVDVARFGPNKSVISFRQGNNARLFPIIKVQGKKDSFELADVIKEWANLFKPDAIVIESTGPSSGVIDILRRDRYRVMDFHPGAPSPQKGKFERLRDVWWNDAREWLMRGGCITEDRELFEELTSIQYSLDRLEQTIKIESKKDYTDRTKRLSPDVADSFVLTFAVKPLRRDSSLRMGGGPGNSGGNGADYDPLDYHARS